MRLNLRLRAFGLSFQNAPAADDSRPTRGPALWSLHRDTEQTLLLLSPVKRDQVHSGLPGIPKCLDQLVKPFVLVGVVHFRQLIERLLAEHFNDLGTAEPAPRWIVFVDNAEQRPFDEKIEIQWTLQRILGPRQKLVTKCRSSRRVVD